MVVLLIDYNHIISSKKHDRLLQKISKPKEAKTTGLILVIRKEAMKTLAGLPKGEKRVEFLNSPSFINSISFHCYIYCDEVCVLEVSGKMEPYLSEILQELNVDFLQEKEIVVKIPLNLQRVLSSVSVLLKNDFSNPAIKTDVLYLSRRMPFSPVNFNTEYNRIHDMIEQYRNSHSFCAIRIAMSPNAVNFLQKTTKKGFTMNGDGTKTQKELTGELTVKEVIKSNGFTYVVDIMPDSVRSGSEEEVDVDATRYNFHSHPVSAYTRHNVENAWPSMTDYLGYLKLGERTIIHCVATIEGLYVLSFSKYWCDKTQEVDTSFVEKHYDIDHNLSLSPVEYVKKINRIHYDGHPIFVVHFFPWNKATQTFSVYFAKMDKVCHA